MADLNDYISINITRATSTISITGFGVAEFIDEFTNFSERVRSYSSLSAVSEDFSTTSNVYKAASKYWGQDRKPTSLLVGRKQIDDVDGYVDTVSNTTDYTLTINENDVTITSDTDATAIEIVAALKVAVDALSVSGLTFTDNADGTFNVAVTTGTDWSIKESDNLVLINGSSPESWVEAITACSEENDDWYVLTASTKEVADQEAIAAYISTLYRWYYTSVNDSSAKSVSTTDDIGSIIVANDYDRAKVLWNEGADDFPELAHIGLCITYTPGQVDWMFKPLTGVVASTMNSTSQGVLGSKGYYTYQSLGGVDVTLTDNKASGLETIKTINVIDYTHARMQEGVYAYRIAQPDVPFTPQSATAIQGILLGVLNDQVAIGGYLATPAPVVTVPNTRSLTAAQRASGELTGITFTASLASSIRYVYVDGTVSF